MRGTGRTTNLLKDAIANAENGKDVIIFAETMGNATTHLVPLLIQILEEQGRPRDSIHIHTTHRVKVAGIKGSISFAAHRDYASQHISRHAIEIFDNDITDGIRQTLEFIEQKNHEASLIRSGKFYRELMSDRADRTV